MRLFHGDNPVISRNNLHLYLAKASTPNSSQIIRLDGKKLTLTVLLQNLENTSLFGEDHLVVIENFFTRPQSKEVTALLAYVKSHPANNLIFWEGKKLTPTQSKLFPPGEISEAKFSRKAYLFLENLGKNAAQSLAQFRQSLADETGSSLHYALTNHIRQLLTLDENPKIPSWLKSRLQLQRSLLNQPALLWLHQQLLDLDYRHKTGQTGQDLAAEIEQIILGLYCKKYENI